MGNCDRLKNLIHGLGETLELKTKPFPTTSEFFAQCYRNIERNAKQLPTVEEERRQQYKEENIGVLTVIEFQASWHILRKFYTDSIINAMIPPSPRETYLTHLYSNREKFADFFPQRESAIEQLAKVGFIELAKYQATKVLTN